MAEVVTDTEALERLLVLLGDPDGDLRFFLPFFENTLNAGTSVQDISSRGMHATNVVAVDDPPVIRGSMLSYRFNGTDEYLEIADNVLLSAVDTVDIACSWGIAFKLDAVSAAIHSLIAKGDMTTPDAEWQMSLTALEYPAMTACDDSVGAAAVLGREDQTAVDVDEWYIMIATYDGAGGDPGVMDGMNIYLWNGGTYLGVLDDADIDGGGAYVDMEAGTGGVVRIGASNTGGAAAEFFDGEIMMPWMTMRELSADEARLVAQQMVKLMGL